MFPEVRKSIEKIIPIVLRFYDSQKGPPVDFRCFSISEIRKETDCQASVGFVRSDSCSSPKSNKSWSESVCLLNVVDIDQPYMFHVRLRIRRHIVLLDND